MKMLEFKFGRDGSLGRVLIKGRLAKPITIAVINVTTAIQIKPRVEFASGSLKMDRKVSFPGCLRIAHQISYHFLGIVG
jgi:hypothetical protein